MTTEIIAPKAHAKEIADLESRLEENKREAQSKTPESYQRVLPTLKPITIFSDCHPEIVLYFMKKYRLLTLKDIGDFAGVTRQRIEFLMNKQRNEDFDFKEFKQEVKHIVDPPRIPADIRDLPDEEWAQIIEIEGNEIDGEYYVSNKGRVCKKLNGETRNIKYTHRKLIMCKPDSNNRIRAGLKFTGIPKRGNFYVNTLVGMFFLENKDPEDLTVVSHKDDDFSNNASDNLFWESKADSLLRKRSPNVKGKNKGTRAESNKSKLTSAKRNTKKA
jgi:hypothetical protein